VTIGKRFVIRPQWVTKANCGLHAVVSSWNGLHTRVTSQTTSQF
jgi:hypothetical protein